MRILAHRGYHRHVAENTLAAFEAARQLGVDGIETDIRLDRDGLPILFHDRALSDGTPVGALSLAELRAATGVEVPTLEAALTGIPDLLWNLEIKEMAAVGPAVRIMNRFRDMTPMFVSSFVHAAVVACVEQTGLDGGLLVAHRPVDALSLFAGVKDHRIRTVIWSAATAHADDFRTLCARGYDNMVYGFAGPAEHALAPAEYVAAIITDFPVDSWG